MKAIQKIAAIAAAAMMAASTMALGASAQVAYTDYASSDYGTFRGSLSIGTSGYKQVSADTILTNGTAPQIAVVLYIFNSSGQQVFYDGPVNTNASYVATGASSADLSPVTAQSHHIVASGTSTWSRMLTLNG